MGTTIRAHISKKNPYYISPHRYYELKHYCLQYPEWIKQRKEIELNLCKSHCVCDLTRKERYVSDPVGNHAIALEYLDRNIKMVERSAKEADESIFKYLLKSVTEGVSYTYLRTALGMPCGKGYFYKAYRRFWWLLSNIKDSGYNLG